MTGTTEQVSPREVGELASAVHGLTAAVGELRTEIATLRTEIKDDYVRKDVLAPVISGIQKEIDGHTAWVVWAQRIVIGAVMAALLALVVVSGGIPH